jgi:16S rRNA C1402 (ribose-2'-O) methylase RsmI
MRKEEMKYHAQETLSNFETVIANHSRITEDEENQKLLEYLTRKKKKMAYFQKWEKEKEKQMEHNKQKAESKLGNAKAN